MKQVIAFLIFQFVMGYTLAQHSSPETIYTYYTTEKITLNGKLDESCWSQATSRKANSLSAIRQQKRLK